MGLALLLDANLPPSLARRLADAGVTAVHVKERGLAHASDESLVEHARERGEVLVSHDLDFSRILAASGSNSPSVIILRLRLPTIPALTNALLTALGKVEADLVQGAIVTIEDAAIRVRMLPVAGE